MHSRVCYDHFQGADAGGPVPIPQEVLPKDPTLGQLVDLKRSLNLGLEFLYAGPDCSSTWKERFLPPTRPKDVLGVFWFASVLKCEKLLKEASEQLASTVNERNAAEILYAAEMLRGLPAFRGAGAAEDARKGLREKAMEKLKEGFSQLKQRGRQQTIFCQLPPSAMKEVLNAPDLEVESELDVKDVVRSVLQWRSNGLLRELQFQLQAGDSDPSFLTS